MTSPLAEERVERRVEVYVADEVESRPNGEDSYRLASSCYEAIIRFLVSRTTG